jgi:hypothetical protein
VHRKSYDWIPAKSFSYSLVKYVISRCQHHDHDHHHHLHHHILVLVYVWMWHIITNIRTVTMFVIIDLQYYWKEKCRYFWPEECRLLRCGAMWVYYKSMFRRNVLPPSSG